MSTTWKRCTRRDRCKICGHGDWCSESADGVFAVCMRDQVGAIKETRNGGYLHRLKDSEFKPHAMTIRLRTPPSSQFETLARKCFGALAGAERAALAGSLGLSADSLERLRVGWSADHNAFTFPMRNSAGGVIGIRLRYPNGSKSSVTGGRSGIFLPADTAWSGRLLVCEGATDTGAMLDMGYTCIGRPDALSCVGIVAELVKRRNYGEVVVVGDGDAVGQRGAESLASTLRTVCRSVRAIVPPDGIKDAREWKACGASHADIEAAINHSPFRTMKVRGVLCA